MHEVTTSGPREGSAPSARLTVRQLQEAMVMKNFQRRWLAVPLAAAAVTTAASAGGGRGNGEEREIPFEEARLFFELNHTDGDLGIHGLVDGDEWKRLEIEDPNDVRMLDVLVRGRLRRQGLTEIFFESAEPPFDELAPAQFFKRFPEGIYDIGGITLDGRELDSEVRLSHVLAAPPANIRVSTIPAAANCDAEPLPSVSGPVIIDWDPVTRSHPTIGKSGRVAVDQYELIVEREEPRLFIFSVTLPPRITRFQVPAGFIALGDSFKFEIITRATNGNQTAVESCFEVE
jgi:hypothetical protein